MLADTDTTFLPVTAAPTETNLLSSRDDSQEGQTLRQPDHHNADVRGPFSQSSVTEDSIDDLVDRIILDGGKSLDDLPLLASPELKVIGRAVALSATRVEHGAKVKYFYTGVVAAVNAQAVTLMHVNRYSEDDFKAYKEREHALAKKHSTRATELKGRDPAARRASPQPQNSSSTNAATQPREGLQAHGYSAEGEVDIGSKGQLTLSADSGALLSMDAAGSLERATAFSSDVTTTESDNAAFDEGSNASNPLCDVDAASAPAARTTRRRHIASREGSMGPLPCVTFSRSAMHDVVFGRDPRSAFYNLFHDANKEAMDVQYLRMFVRRYLVHTSAGNNPAKVSLYTYVANRSGCATLDRGVVYGLIREELPELIKADRSIEKEKAQQQRRLERQRNDPSLQGGALATLFEGTGVLFRTGLPQRSFVVGLLLFALVVVCLVFFAVSVGMLGNTIVTGFLFRTLWYVVASIVVWAIASLFTILHAIFMRLPLRKDLLLLTTRVVFTVGGIACAALTIAMIGKQLSSDASLYNFLADQPGNELCAFYEKNQCSGLYTSCNSFWYRDPVLCNVPCTVYFYDTTTCYSALWSPVQYVLIPLMIFSIAILAICVYSSFELILFFMKAYRMAQASN